ncbi:MAG: transporter substrate-binding protein [Deltaproteobacteria bacterium]|nr:transporter substrate-binding protein [Deltaproteobacteria bacterium]
MAFRLRHKILRLAAASFAAFVFFPLLSWAAQTNTRAIIHIPTKSLTSMPLFFGKDKGFFTREGVDVDLVLMSPPTAIAALVAGELDFSTTVGAGISATMRGLPIKRVLYIQQYVTFSLMTAPEIKTVRDLVGKSLGAVALTDATAIAAREILKGSGIDPSAVNFFYTQSTESSRTALTSKKIAAAMLPPPFAEETEVRGFNRLAEAKDFAPLSGIGLLASADLLKKNPAKGVAVIRAVLRTMGYMRDPKNHSELIDYILRIHKIDANVAAHALATVMAVYSKDGTKPADAVQSEIDIYREALKISQPFTAENLEDMTYLKRANETLNR